MHFRVKNTLKSNHYNNTKHYFSDHYSLCTVGWVYFGKLGDEVFGTFTNLNTYPYHSMVFLVKKPCNL